MDSLDPLGYYARLGVAPDAPASVVRAAYRALAQELHPDRNPSPGATQKFQELQRAYHVLSDTGKRAAYDASAATAFGSAGAAGAASRGQAHGSHEPPQERRRERTWEPVRCVRCNAVSASPRVRVFLNVVGYFVGATKTPAQGIFCARCETIVGLRSTGGTLLLGWWSIHGFFWSWEALFTNIFGARQTMPLTARVLTHQAQHFLSTGKYALAAAVAKSAISALGRGPRGSAEQRRRAALGYPPPDEDQGLRETLQGFVAACEARGDGGMELKDTLGIRSKAFAMQSALIGAFFAVLGGWVFYEQQESARVEQARLEAAGIARANAAAIAQRQAAELAAQRQPLPMTGPYNSLDLTNAPPLKISAPSGANWFVKLDDWNTGLTRYMLFVRGGEAAEVGVPAGTYRIKFASGSTWYGDEIRFGPDTTYSVIDKPTTFSIAGSQLLGHEISLTLRRDGNLRRQSISAGQF